MSDGEKSALLLAAEVLCGPSKSTFIIDEPERHLHRSMSAGLVAAVMADRTDSHFIILTHDLDLAASLKNDLTNKFVLSDCVWQNQMVVGWELHSVDESGIAEEARRAVLGGRRQILFLEGQSQSLDNGLYRMLYPGVTLNPVGSCEQVIRAVGGIRDSLEQHWLQAAGIVDADGRTNHEIAALVARGILVLPVSEIENLYYTQSIMEAIAKQQAELLNFDTDKLYADAVAACLKALAAGDAPERLSASVAQKLIYRKTAEQLPDRQAIATSGGTIAVQIDLPFQDLLTSYHKLLNASDLESLLRQFPIRDTSARTSVAGALYFKSMADYEAAVHARLRTDQSLMSTVRAFLGQIFV